MPLLLKRAGMRLEQFREDADGFVEARLVGIQGHWEDGAALMWATEMKKLGLEPPQNDPEWSQLCDSKGNQLYGTKKSRINGIWLKWKKPTNVVSDGGQSEITQDQMQRYDAQEGDHPPQFPSSLPLFSSVLTRPPCHYARVGRSAPLQNHPRTSLRSRKQNGSAKRADQNEPDRAAASLPY